jgi:hypothetical protein
MLLKRALLVNQELSDLSGISMAKIYKDQKAGILPFKMAGGRRRVSVPDALKYAGLDSL